MSLPVSRNRTYSAASQVASADLNDMQDQIIALATTKTVTRVFPASTGVTYPSDPTLYYFLGNTWVSTHASGTLIVPIPVATGETITAWSAGVTTSGVISGQMKSRSFLSNVIAFVGAAAATVTTGAQVIGTSGLSETIVGSDKSYSVEFTPDTAVSRSVTYVAVTFLVPAL